ncbi:Uncharacterised protein [Mycobacteroides abscessus subsp. massiliense]|nr:Uncharacterised protein [Mycobacteroides abscessus subsp. massiliense]
MEPGDLRCAGAAVTDFAAADRRPARQTAEGARLTGVGVPHRSRDRRGARLHRARADPGLAFWALAAWVLAGWRLAPWACPPSTSASMPVADPLQEIRWRSV